MNLQIEEKNKDSIPYLVVKGEIDVYTSPSLKEKILELIEKGNKSLIINLQDVSYIDSTGLGVLIGGLRRCKEKNGDVYLIYSNPRLKRIFEITGLNNSFKIAQDEEGLNNILKGDKI